MPLSIEIGLGSMQVWYGLSPHPLSPSPSCPSYCSPSWCWIPDDHGEGPLKHRSKDGTDHDQGGGAALLK